MKPSTTIRTFLSSLLALALFFTQLPLVQAQTGATIKIEEGTQVRLRLMETLSSATAQMGQTVNFEVLDDVKVGDTVVIAQGATAWGTIVEAEQKKSLGRAGKLGVSVEYVKAVDGTKVPLRAQAKKQGEGKGTATGIATGVAVVFFWPAAPFFLLRKGKDIEIPRSQEVKAFVDGDRTVGLKGVATSVPPVALAPVAVPVAVPVAQPVARVAAPEFGMINVTANADNAEVQIDGNFYGNTPSAVKVPAGSHTITVTAPGYESWTRTMQVSAGSTLTARAELTRTAAPRRPRR